jgi:adenylyltransferase/sulfurtransferase
MLSDRDIERFQRHILLKEIGGPGQQRLRAAKVLVIGAGGLGSPCLLYLAAAGVGTLGIVDDDKVALSNLQRQILHGTDDVGRSKIESARDSIARIDPDVEVAAHPQRLDGANAEDIIAPYDLVADGSDNYATRAAVNAACVALRKPLVSAAVGRFDGQLSTFKGYLPGKPCYRCLYPDDPGAGLSCEEEGVLGAVTGILGTLQASEVVKEIAGFGESLAGRLLVFDALATEMRALTLTADPKCPVCAERKADAPVTA